jgi:hypothetical protein
MTKELVLSKKDITLLVDVLEYFMSDEGVEKQDFRNTFGEELFDLCDHLEIDLCKSEHYSHIYYKMSILSQSLAEEIN